MYVSRGRNRIYKYRLVLDSPGFLWDSSSAVVRSHTCRNSKWCHGTMVTRFGLTTLIVEVYNFLHDS